VLPRRNGRVLEPTCALWSRERVLPIAREQLATGRLPMHELVARLDARFVEDADLRAIDPRATALANANTPDEWTFWERAFERILAEPGAS
jgi:molybdopterin-guanine dinucleotide biosynthesis protein A